MAKVQAQGCGALGGAGFSSYPHVWGGFPFLYCLLFFFFLPSALPNDEHGQVEKKNANGFAITTFSSC